MYILLTKTVNKWCCNWKNST